MKLPIQFVISAALLLFFSLSKANDEVVVVARKLNDDTNETEDVPHPRRNLQLQLKQRWKDRIGDVVIVPCTIAGTFSATDTALIDGAVKDLGDRSAVVKFVPRINQRAYIEVRNNGEGCRSYVGRVPSGTSQILNLAQGCLVAGIIQHEFLHAVRVCERY